MNDNGLEKSARLLMLIGSHKGSQVIKLLTFQELEKIVSIMLNLKKNSFEDVHRICFECRQLLQRFKYKNRDLNKYVLSMLSKALGDITASNLLNSINKKKQLAHNIDVLNKMTATKIIALLDNEHPQIITTILIHLEHDKRLEILSLLPDNIILEVILRIASFSELNDVATLEFFNIINVLLVSKNKKSNSAYKDYSNIRKGIDLAVTLLNSLKKTTKIKIINRLNQRDANISKKILDRMMLFKNLCYLSDTDIQILLKEIDTESIYIAIYNMNQKFQDKFLKNMSEDQACYFRTRKKIDNLNFSNDIIINKQNFILKIVEVLVKHNKISLDDSEKRYDV